MPHLPTAGRSVAAVLSRIAIRLLILAAAIWLTTWLLPDVRVNGGVLTYLWVALLFAIVNAVLGPILHLLALPLTLLTFGLFALVVNGALVAITASLSSDFTVSGFWPGVLTAILISVFSSILNRLVRH